MLQWSEALTNDTVFASPSLLLSQLNALCLEESLICAEGAAKALVAVLGPVAAGQGGGEAPVGQLSPNMTARRGVALYAGFTESGKACCAVTLEVIHSGQVPHHHHAPEYLGWSAS